MKKLKSIIMLLIIAFAANAAIAKDKTADVIKKAMKDELRRNINNLTLGELERPFYISYTIFDAKTLVIESTLGSIISSEEMPVRNQNTRLLVGDYKRTNENYLDMSNVAGMAGVAGSANVPLDNDYNGIRRSLWLSTDKQYKAAAETFAKKLSSMKQQKLNPEDTALFDFSKADKVNIDLKSRQFNIDKKKWEKIARELSAIFKDYNDIFSSNVSIYFYSADAYFANSEGTMTKQPFSIAAVRAVANTQADDGASLYDHVLHFALTPEDLPSLNSLKKEIQDMAENLSALRNAPVIDDSYSGPVLFEGQAAGEIYSQRLFGGTSGLMAVRKPIAAEAQYAAMVNMMIGKTLEDKIDKKVISKDITIKSKPELDTYKGIKLIGSYKVDAEGVIPDKEMTLVDKGVLKTLMNGRTPTAKVKESNGHQRYSFLSSMLQPMTGPGVIEIETANGDSRKNLKKALIETAKENDQDYAYIVRKLESPIAGIKKDMDQSAIIALFTGGGKKGGVSKPLYVYRVDVKTGKEELVRSVDLGGISIKTMKNILGSSDKQMVYNTLVTVKAGGFDLSSIFSSIAGGWTVNGTPASFIAPDALLVEELDIDKEKSAFTKKLPVVENPVGQK